MGHEQNRLRRIGRLSIAMVAFGLVAAACGGGDDAANTTTTIAAVAPAATTQAPAPTTTAPQPTTTTLPPDPGIPATATTLVVQSDLTFLEYFEGPIDGIAGEETQAAISAFQTDSEIEPHTLPPTLFTAGNVFHDAMVLESPESLEVMARRLATGLSRPSRPSRKTAKSKYPAPSISLPGSVARRPENRQGSGGNGSSVCGPREGRGRHGA